MLSHLDRNLILWNLYSSFFHVLSCFVQATTYCCYFWLYTIFIEWKVCIIFFLLNANFWGSWLISCFADHNHLIYLIEISSQTTSPYLTQCQVTLLAEVEHVHFVLSFLACNGSGSKPHLKWPSSMWTANCLYSIPTESGEYLA